MFNEKLWLSQGPHHLPESHHVIRTQEDLGCSLFFQESPWASLVAQMVNNPLAMRETWVRSMGWEDPLEEGMATRSFAQAPLLSLCCITILFPVFCFFH